MRIVFMGSPEFALPSLQKLIESEHELVGVFTQPDRPVGRGRRIAPPPVKRLAEQHGIPVFQPKNVSKPEAVERLRALKPDLGVVAAYGQILRQAVLDVPPLGILNVHASLLPRWRGAAPIPAAILAGDTVTGATIMKIVLALDAGPMLGRVDVRIEPDDTTATLTPRVAKAGAELLLDVLPRWAAGAMEAIEQDEAEATYAPQLTKTDGLIAWDRDDAELIARQVRAYNPWPIAYSFLDGRPFRILEAVALNRRYDAPPGTVFAPTGVGEPPPFAAGFGVTTAGNDLGVERVQPPGGKVMLAADYINGHRDVIGKRFSSG